MPIMLEIVFGTIKGDIWLALLLFLGILTYAWAKQKLGEASIAIAFVLIMGAIFINHTEFVWIVIGGYLFITYGKQIFKV
jgi:hypothetical protein